MTQKQMKEIVAILLVCIGAFSCSCKKEDGPQVVEPIAVTKTNTTKVYMHYMPWFNSKSISGSWGIHWRMANKNPEVILPNGQREIASHYYPLIGPYDTSDPDLIDYHVLLMKYSGIDGVLIDWYGSYSVLDYGSILKNSNAFIEGIKRVGLNFSLVYEDNTAYEVARRKGITEITAAQEDLKYARDHYFSSPNYIEIEGKPLLLTFGPRFFKTPTQWTEILSVLNEKPTFFPLWNHKYRVGDDNAAGEFSWVDFTTTLEDLDHFYKNSSVGLRIGSAYAGFHDFYKQGGWGDSYGHVDHQDGATLSQTLQKFQESHLPYLQLVTWNDFGEGTMLEPTVEFQYQFLETLQEYTGVTYKKSDLETIYTYYVKRKELKGNVEAQATLDEVFDALNALEITRAQELLQQL